MSKQSAGILLYRHRNDELELYLAHPGGPFFAKKDLGAWIVPKGEAEEGEDLESAARRELKEETGLEVSGTGIPLGSVKLKSGKVVHAWAYHAAADTAEEGPLSSNTFKLEWPPRSGRTVEFPEVDRTRFFLVEEALKRINPAQTVFIHRLVDHFRM